MKSKLDRKNRKMWAKAKAKREKLREKLLGLPKGAGPAAGASALVLAGLVLAGCQATPSRTNSMSFSRCTVTVYAGRAPAEGPGGDVLSQNMAIETGRDETLSTSATVSPSTDVSLSRGGGAGGGLVSDVARLIHGEPGAAKAEPEPKVCPECPGGECAACGDGPAE